MQKPNCCGSEMSVLADPKLGGVEVKKASFHVNPDIAPYQAMGVDAKTGKAPVITSRREHREFLKRNGYIEIGNETPIPKREAPDHNVRRELAEATREVFTKHNLR